MSVIRPFVVAFPLILAMFSSARGEGFHLHSFRRVQLTDVYYSEGANFGDLNQDGVMDVGKLYDDEDENELRPPEHTDPQLVNS